jgi:hypothetical protein
MMPVCLCSQQVSAIAHTVTIRTGWRTCINTQLAGMRSSRWKHYCVQYAISSDQWTGRLSGRYRSSGRRYQALHHTSWSTNHPPPPCGPLTTASGSFKNLTGLTPGTTYDYQVEAVCNTGSSNYSTVKSFTTAAISQCTDIYEPNEDAHHCQRYPCKH